MDTNLVEADWASWQGLWVSRKPTLLDMAICTHRRNKTLERCADVKTRWRVCISMGKCFDVDFTGTCIIELHDTEP